MPLKRGGVRLKSRESNSANGTANCNTTTDSANHCHPAPSRLRYHVISLGKLPDQIIKNCENAKYALTIKNASSRFPRSLKIFANHWSRGEPLWGVVSAC